MLTLLLVLAFAASMAGGLAPAVAGFIDRLGPPRLLSFRSGLLVAVAAADVLPEAWAQNPLASAGAAAAAVGLGWALHRDHHEEHEGHELTHPHVHDGAHVPAALAALFVHSLIDGLNLGAIALVGGPALLAVGAATGLHKLADGFTVTSLFPAPGRPRGRALAALVAASLMTPLGAAAGRAGVLSLGPVLTAVMLGFAGGSFLFVGAIQIGPHLRRHPCTDAALAFAAGLVAMLLLRRLSA